MIKENFQTEVAVKTKTFVTEKIIAVAIIISSFSSLVLLGAYMTAPLWQNQVAITTQQQNSATDQQMKIVADPLNNGYIQPTVARSLENYSPTDDLPYHSGWPVTLNVNSNQIWPGVVSPVVDDLDGDGQKELVISVQGYGEQGIPSKLLIYRQDGQLAYEWSSLEYAVSPFELPTIVDLNNDGQKEIMIGEYAWYEGQPKILVFNNRARIISAIVNNYWAINELYSHVAVDDVDNNSHKEIFYTGWAFTHGSFLVGLDDRGNNLPGFPIQLQNAQFSSGVSPVLADINGDRNKEIVVASHLNDQGVTPDRIRAFNYQGNLLWEQEFNGRIYHQLASGDINNDGRDEIIFNTSSGLYVLDGTGRYLINYFIAGNWVNTPPAVGDLDGDGFLEIIFGNYRSIYVLRHNGELLSEIDFENYVYYSSPTIGDINNDGQQEIIYGQFYSIKAWDYLGNLIQNFPLTIPHEALYVVPTLADLNNDGRLELISSSSSYWSYDQPVVYVWDTNSTFAPQRLAWPMLAHDPAHTGNYRSPQ